MIGQVFGNFRILEKAGEGGMGAVYRAVDVMLDRPVAIKVLRPELANDANIAERFRAEAVTLAKLNHPNITTLYSLFRQGEHLLMVMEFVQGEALSNLIQRSGALEMAFATRVLCKALEGIGHAHQLGVIHRDIKPANIMLTPSGEVKVMDFGIARVLGSDRRTRSGMLVGTIGYMAPELIQGGGGDERSDIYAVGIALYEMLAGRLPFDGKSEYELMRAHIESPVPPLSCAGSHIPTHLEQIVLRAIAKQPEARFQTASEFLEAVQRFVRSLGSRPTIADTPLATGISAHIGSSVMSEPARETQYAEERVLRESSRSQQPRAADGAEPSGRLGQTLPVMPPFPSSKKELIASGASSLGSPERAPKVTRFAREDRAHSGRLEAGCSDIHDLVGSEGVDKGSCGDRFPQGFPSSAGAAGQPARWAEPLASASSSRTPKETRYVEDIDIQAPRDERLSAAQSIPSLHSSDAGVRAGDGSSPAPNRSSSFKWWAAAGSALLLVVVGVVWLVLRPVSSPPVAVSSSLTSLTTPQLSEGDHSRSGGVPSPQEPAVGTTNGGMTIPTAGSAGLLERPPGIVPPAKSLTPPLVSPEKPAPGPQPESKPAQAPSKGTTLSSGKKAEIASDVGDKQQPVQDVSGAPAQKAESAPAQKAESAPAQKAESAPAQPGPAQKAPAIVGTLARLGATGTDAERVEILVNGQVVGTFRVDEPMLIPGPVCRVTFRKYPNVSVEKQFVVQNGWTYTCFAHFVLNKGTIACVPKL